MTTDNPAAVAVLEGAAEIIKERGATHGDTEASFAMIGELWFVYLNNAMPRTKRITPEMVAEMMGMVKLARSTYGNKKPEHFVDKLGYGALASQMVENQRTRDNQAHAKGDTNGAETNG